MTKKEMHSLEQKFERLLKTYKGTIYSVCYMFSDSKAGVEDLFQETLVNLWRGFAKFRGDSNVKTWIWRVCLNTCISSSRKQKRLPARVPLSVDIDLFAAEDDDSRQIRLLQKRICRLGLFDRAIVMLWLENLSYDEIGEIVGISAKNVSVRLFRIRERLRSMSD